MGAHAIRVVPEEAEKSQVAQLYRMLIHDGSAALIGPDGTRIELPPSVYEVLVKVVENVLQGKKVAVLPETELLSTQAAADMLGVSRQFLVRELEQGKIPFQHVGTHRRIYLTEVLNYAKTRTRERRASIDRMAQKMHDLGVYDTFIPPEE